MTHGYMGKMFLSQPSSKTITEEALDAKCAAIISAAMALAPDPLQPSETRRRSPWAGKYARFVAARLPVSGSHRCPLYGRRQIAPHQRLGRCQFRRSFGPYLKFSGFDAVFFTGISPNPVYLLLDEGKAEIKDAGRSGAKIPTRPKIP